jgi:hypothetical protein
MSKPIDPFHAEWQRFHPDSVPVGGSLRDGGTWNVARFHLLPHGRTVTVSRGDYRSLIDRFRIMATEILGEGGKAWLVAPDPTGPDGQPLNSTPKSRARFHRFKQRYGLTTRWQFYSTADGCIYNVEAGPITWHEESLARLFVDVYHQRLINVLLMNAETGAVVAPYETGVFVSQPTPEALMALVDRYHGWLPVTGDGTLRFDPAQMKSGNFQVSKSCAAAIQKALGT